MTTENLNELFDMMLDRATERYSQTTESKLGAEKLDGIYEQSKYNFTDDELSFAEECFDTIMKVQSSETAYIYLQGFRDCATLLKHIYLV